MKTSLALGGIVVSIVLMMLAMFTYAGKGPIARPVNRDVYLRQLENDDAVPQQIDSEYAQRQNYQTSQMLMSLALCLGFGSAVGYRYVARREAAAAKPRASAEL